MSSLLLVVMTLWLSDADTRYPKYLCRQQKKSRNNGLRERAKFKFVEPGGPINYLKWFDQIVLAQLILIIY